MAAELPDPIYVVNKKNPKERKLVHRIDLSAWLEAGFEEETSAGESLSTTDSVPTNRSPDDVAETGRALIKPDLGVDASKSSTTKK